MSSIKVTTVHCMGMSANELLIKTNVNVIIKEHNMKSMKRIIHSMEVKTTETELQQDE